MRAHEFLSKQINEDVPIAGAGEPLHQNHMSAIKGAVSLPGLTMNKSNGSQYAWWRFGIAMAGAGAPEEDHPTASAGFFSGDPLLTTYTDHEMDIIKAAADKMGAVTGGITQLTRNKSEEPEGTNKSSPVAGFKGYYKSPKKKIKGEKTE
jgi:hypothetical protein